MAIYPLTLFLLSLVLAVLAFDNWKTGQIRNWASLLVLIGGVASSVARVEFSPAGADELFIGTWLLMAVGLIALVLAGLAGGVSKLLIAMLPWFHPEQFFILFILFGFTHAGFAYLIGRRGDTPAVPAIATSTLLIAIFLV